MLPAAMTHFSRSTAPVLQSLVYRFSLAGLLAMAITACSSAAPDTDAGQDQLVLQVCLRDPAKAGLKQIDITAVQADNRDTGLAMAIGTTTRQQTVLETDPGPIDAGTTVMLTLDRIIWYAYTPPYVPARAAWSEWQPASFVTPSEDPAYKLQHGMLIERNLAGKEAVQIRYRMMGYHELLAARSARHFQIPRTDFVPCQ